MKKLLFKIQICALSSILLFFICCNEQVKTNFPTDEMNEVSITPIGYPKLKKSINTNKNHNINCSLQDKKGNIWFGSTGNGIYKYDGKLFYNYTLKEGLSSNQVMSIIEDRSGIIWIGTNEGICRFDGLKITQIPITGNFINIDNNSNYYSDQSTKNTVWSILEDKTGKIWFGTGIGVFCYDGKTFTRFLQNDWVINKENLHLKVIDCILEDKKGNIWFASGCPPVIEGISIFDGKSISSFKPNGDGWIRTIREEKTGILWFGGRANGNFTYDGKNFKNFTEMTNIGNPYLIDKEGNIWFNGEEKLSSVESLNGIWVYDGSNYKNFNMKDGLSKYHVCSMLEDKEGNIWIGTRNTGLFKFDGKTFSDYSEQNK